jgi:site-specific recombinase XerD
MTISELLTEYLNELKSDSTRINYKIALTDFLEAVSDIAQITTEFVENYRKKLQKKRKSAQTIRAKLAAIRGFLDYCWTAGYITLNPADSVKIKPTQKYKNAKNITEKDFKYLLAQTNSRCKGLRDSLLIRLIYLYGDVEKVLQFKWAQVMPTQNLATLKSKLEASILKLFDKKTYVTGLSPTQMWEQFRQGYIFFTFENTLPNSNKPISISAIRSLFKQYCELAGFSQNYIDFQALKRLRAKEIFKKTGSAEEVRKFCGHQNIQITKSFLKTLD